MTFHGTNRLIHTTRKRTANHTENIIMSNTHNINLNATPIAISTSPNHSSYRSSMISSIDPITNTTTTKNDYIFQSPTSSINFKPVNITFSKNRKETQKYDVIDITNITKPTSCIIKKEECISSTIPISIDNNNNDHHRHYRNHRNSDRNEIFELCKWCLFCLAALGSCIVFISYLIQITGNMAHFGHRDRNNNKEFMPHHHEYYVHHSKIGSSVGDRYMNRNRNKNTYSMLHRIPIESHHNDNYDINDLSIINNINIDKKLKIENINRENDIIINKKQNIDHLVRNDKYSILNDILFLVFKSDIDDKVNDGRDIIKKTWGKKYKYLYDINIKFINTASSKFIGAPFDDVIEAPFIGESAMCLLWTIDEYTDDYKWIFKLNDITFVMIENLVDYLNEIEFESTELAHKNNNNLDIEHHYYWWLGNQLQQTPNDSNSIYTSGGAGYLLNRAILDLIVDDIRNYDELNNNNNNKHNKYEKYMMCKQENIDDEDLCISYLLNRKYNIHSASTLDMDNNEKFNVWDPMTLFGYGGIYKLPINWYTKYKENMGEEEEQKIGINYISKTPITFHYVKPEWMEAYYQLFYQHKKPKDIHIISKYMKSEERLKNLYDYAQIVTQYSLTNHIRDIHNEMKYIITDINYNLVK